MIKILTTVIMLIHFCLPAFASESASPPGDFYKGTINGKLDFIMVLKQSKNGCAGSYAYKAHRKQIYLQGVCEPKRFELKENAYDGRPKANRFIGTRNDPKIEGFWRSADDKKEYKFEAIQFPPKKSEILAEAKGEYRLESIEGFYGANTMTDIYKLKGDWKASGSGISGGQRESYAVKLSKKEKQILSSFRIIVDESLAISLFANGEKIAAFPNTEKSVFSIKNILREEDTINRIYIYRDINNFSEDKLHIITTDEIDLSKYIVFENTPLDSEYAVSIDYIPLTGRFELSIIDKNCCGGTTLDFAKH